MTEIELLEQKDLRNKAIDRVDVLEKVKKLFLIPEMEVMTTKMVADYYEVTQDVIKMCYFNNKSEIKHDGIVVKRISEIKDLCSKMNLLYKAQQGKITFTLNDCLIEIPNAGITCFPKRAILRVGMLLRDSEVAKEVRTQLLNTFEKATVEQRTESIDEEMKLKYAVTNAYFSGNLEQFASANMNYLAFKNRYIEKIESENCELSKLYDDLKTVNSLLTKKTLEWGNKAILNALMRSYAYRCFPQSNTKFQNAWSDLYRQVKYKHGWDMNARETAPRLIDRITDDEFPEVIKIAVGMLEANNVDVAKIINGINVENIKAE